MKSKAKSLQVYSSIEDLPTWNWLQIFKTDDLSHLLLKKIRVSKKSLPELVKAWSILWDEYISHFGFGEEFISIHEKRKEIAQLKLQRIITGDRYWNTFINVAESELQLLKKEMPKGGDFWQMKSAMDKKVGFRIDIKEMPVIEFYTLLNSLKK